MVLHEVELAFNAGDGFGGDTTFGIAEYLWISEGFWFSSFIVFEFEKDSDQDFEESQVEVGTTDEVKEAIVERGKEGLIEVLGYRCFIQGGYLFQEILGWLIKRIHWRKIYIVVMKGKLSDPYENFYRNHVGALAVDSGWGRG